jgi:hypothetical protein
MAGTKYRKIRQKANKDSSSDFFEGYFFPIPIPGINGSLPGSENNSDKGQHTKMVITTMRWWGSRYTPLLNFNKSDPTPLALRMNVRRMIPPLSKVRCFIYRFLFRSETLCISPGTMHTRRNGTKSQTEKNKDMVQEYYHLALNLQMPEEAVKNIWARPTGSTIPALQTGPGHSSPSLKVLPSLRFGFKRFVAGAISSLSIVTSSGSRETGVWQLWMYSGSRTKRLSSIGMSCRRSRKHQRIPIQWFKGGFMIIIGSDRIG